MIRILKQENRKACLKAGLLVAAGLALSGCIRISFPPTGESIRAAQANHEPGTHVSIRGVSVRPVFAVHYKEVILPGPGQRPISRNVPPVLQFEGHYHNWQWVIRADPRIAAQWQKGRVLLVRETTARGGQLSPALLHWRVMMKRLYLVDAYLLGRTPMPVDFKLLLRAPGHYRYQGTVRSKYALPVRIAYMVNPERSPHKLESVEVSNLYAITQLFQTILVVGEWKYGDLPRPSEKDLRLRHLKGDVDISAWVAAADAALVGDSSELPPTVRRSLYTPFMHQRYGHALVHFLTHQYADSLTTGPALASQLVRLDWGRYLRHRKLSLSWPGRGPALARYANATIDYCRALTRFRGNILTWAPPLDLSRARGFFPQPSSHNHP